MGGLINNENIHWLQPPPCTFTTNELKASESDTAAGSLKHYIYTSDIKHTLLT